MTTIAELERTSFLYGANAPFIEELFLRFLQDPTSVDPSWRVVFEELDGDARGLFERLREASRPRPPASGRAAGPAWTPTVHDDAVRSLIRDHLRVIMLIRAYRVRGHLIADLDPLGLTERAYHPELDYRTYGFTEADLEREFYLDFVLGLERATLATILDVLRRTYSGTVGVEFLHIQDPEQKAWIQAKIEGRGGIWDASAEDKREILRQLTLAEGFETFLHRRFPGTKRFGIDGGESAIPALEAIIRTYAELGAEEVVLGMAHRGRLNVLANVMGKPYAAILSEFQGEAVYDAVQGSGDVKYHLGTSTDRVFGDRRIHLSLTANPSHLEAVDPVVMGKARAKQRQKGDIERTRVGSVLVHGDAAFIGQGVVHECLEMSALRGYRVGGTVHLIVNNQIGFTTSPAQARSSPYPSDVARGVQCPVFHVNGDDPIAVVQVARLATEFRQRFRKDVVIDLWCYRRHGHNESDEPSFTQPLMYRRIAQHPTVRQILAERLEAEGLLAPGEAEEMLQAVYRTLEEAHEASRSYRPNKLDWLEGAWSGLRPAPVVYVRGTTGVPVERLRELGVKLTELPPELNVHPRLRRIIAQRRRTIEEGEGIDWATAEQLAFATLLVEGFPVRLSGEDVGRGTFSQRHAVIVDQVTEEHYIPLAHLSPDQAPVEIVDSMLSEEGVLGFEYGYSLADPNCLTIWEAQFGDFANGAQVYFDQFISSGEAKWLRMSGLVCLLPHGYEGQGPEHSSARIERFLQLYAENNIQCVNCTTPANFFHVLRRQLHRDFRKPLIVFTPKSLLRHRRCVSSLADMGVGTSFHRVLYERPPGEADQRVERVVLCSGKVYYELLETRAALGLDERVTLVRLEQLAPFPEEPLVEELRRYPEDAVYVWCQEEPRNMGPWFFVAPRIENILQQLGKRYSRLAYVGRPPSAATATGFVAQHEREQTALLQAAFTVAPGGRFPGDER